jgi:hypothetical protein
VLASIRIELDPNLSPRPAPHSTPSSPSSRSPPHSASAPPPPTATSRAQRPADGQLTSSDLLVCGLRQSPYRLPDRKEAVGEELDEPSGCWAPAPVAESSADPAKMRRTGCRSRQPMSRPASNARSRSR